MGDSGREDQPIPAENGQPVPSAGDPDFWRHQSLEELAAEQGVQPVDEETLDAMGDAWPEEEDLEEFLAWLRESRRGGRS